MPGLVTIYGGSGFVGRYVTQRMAHAGWRVRVAVRRPNEALFVRTYGVVGQVEPVFCNIRDDASVRAAMAGADAVVNCVGILAEHGRNRFEAVHHHGAARIARFAAEGGVGRLVHLSALGADPASESAYLRSKAAGEQAVQEACPEATIMRPSVIFGPEDRFFNKFARMALFSPVLFIVGGETRFQPVHVDDVARAIEAALCGPLAAGRYELGGPDTCSLRALVRLMLGVIERRRLVVDLPFRVGGLGAAVLDALQAATLGLFRNGVLTRDQLRTLRHDMTVAPGAPGLAELGVEPVALESVLPEYLWPYRPAGQFAAIRRSLKKLGA